MVLVTWIIISLLTFAGADTDIFKLETEMPQPEKLDLLKADDLNPDLDFSLERIITGNFSLDGSVNSILLERHTAKE